MTSSNKTSTFQDEHKSDNEETPLVKSHQGPFVSKQETWEVIKRLHIKCGFLDTEHLLMIPKTWLDYLQNEDFDVDISEHLYNANCAKKSIYFGNIPRVGIPKSMVLVIIFRVFMWPLSLINSGPISIIHLQCLELLYQKLQYHLIKARWTMELVRCLLILKWHPKWKKVLWKTAMPRLTKQWSTIFYLLT